MKAGYAMFPQGNVVSEPTTLPDQTRMAHELSMANLAGELGFDSFWVTEHHFGDYNLAPAPLTVLSFIAGRFPQMELGSMVVVLPWNDPLRVIEQTVILDYLSERPAAARHRQGRGGARVQRLRHGSRRGPQAVRGQPRPAARGAQDGRAAPRGRARHRDPPDAAHRLQGPHPDGRRARRSRSTAPPTPACRWCASSCAAGTRSPSRSSATRSASRPPSATRRRPACCSPTRSATATPARRPSSASATPAPTGRRPSATTAWRTSENDLRRFAEDQIWGTPDEIVEKCEDAARTIGTDHIAFAFRYAGVPYEEAEASMRLFASDVLPRLQRLEVTA